MADFNELIPDITGDNDSESDNDSDSDIAEDITHVKVNKKKN